MVDDHSKILAWFLGPKAENAPGFEELMLLTLRDYAHWRRNYFPSDDVLITKTYQRQLVSSNDKLYQNLLELTAELRRNFPFYSPRYIGHMLSDTLLPSLLGYFAGMLYNPNNVTPEAAPVTVDMEIEACNEIVKMLGFTPSPSVPKDFDQTSISNYKKELQNEFAWAHITQGGTTANIEALWIARTIKYAPLAVWDIARKDGLAINIKLPNGQSKDIRRISKKQLLFIKPNEAIYLLAKYVDAFKSKYSLPLSEASKSALSLLSTSPYSLNKGISKVMQEFPPVLFVSGTAHYSIQKAADLLGIGRDNIELIEMDASFRISIEDLKNKMMRTLSQNRIPLAVIAIMGTTEEGAVDPVHKILDFREELEKNENVSFWIHVDAAWGGYIRSLFNLSIEDEVEAVISKISKNMALRFVTDYCQWNNSFFELVESKLSEYLNDNLELKGKIEQRNFVEKNIKAKINGYHEKLDYYVSIGNNKEYLRLLRRFFSYFQELNLGTVNIDMNLDDRIELVNEYVSTHLHFRFGEYERDLDIRWGSKDVGSAFIGMSKADSITIDPHKMGYVNYPCGMVAFKNDRVRHFIIQKAPYITSIRQDILIHMPPKHLEKLDDSPRVVVEAFAPFIVEGSRPGAAATALWLTTKTIPPTMKESGSIIRASLLSARELYEWLIHWEKISERNKSDKDYQYLPLTINPPDTNVVIFSIKKKTSNSLSKMNRLTELVYEHFTIQTELGEREYSYAQPFFLSKTTFEEPIYPFNSLRKFFEMYFSKTYTEKLHETYKTEGLKVLRASVMNPYIAITNDLQEHSILRDFMGELSNAANESVKLI